MQNIKVLHTEENGYIAHCSCCGHVQVAFNVVILNFTLREFESFYSLVAGDLKNFRYNVNPVEKNFIYNTGCLKAQLLFCYEELEQLFNIMQPARVILNANMLLQNYAN